MKNLTLIKLGGSVITQKEVPMEVRRKVLSRLVQEIAQADKQTDETFIIGHGQGSFAHAPAMRYRTMDGFISKDSRIGMAITQDSAAQLNRIVVHQFITEEMPAVSFMMSNVAVAANKKPKHLQLEVLLEYLEKGLLPVMCGDVIVDEKMGCTIWSTETGFEHLIESLTTDKTSGEFKVHKVVHVSEVAGVLDAQGKTVPEITPKNSQEVKSYINGTKGFDVTGGMWHKIEASLALTEKGITSHILSGLTKDNLYNCLTEQPFEGTTIHS